MPIKKEQTMTKKPLIRAFFDEPTNTVSYLVADPETRSITVTAYVATWTFSTQPALGCGAASETYTATLFAA